MSYTTLKLITNAYYSSGIVARSLQTLTGEQSTDGLFFLNEILAKKRIEDGTLPYYTQYDFTMEAGEQTTFIENLTECELVTFEKNNFRYAMYNQSRRRYWGCPKPLGIETLPSYFTMDRTLGGSNISVTFSPDQDYPATLWGLFALDSVTLLQDLSETFDDYYISYLRYDLAVTLCLEFGQPVPAPLYSKFLEYDKAIRKRSGPVDLKNTSISTLGPKLTVGWGQINIGQGNVPVGWARGF